MTTEEPDPLIHDPTRLRIAATLAALPDGDTLSVTRLQDMLGQMPGSLITHLGELDSAGYVQAGKSGSDASAPATVALTRGGRDALERYASALRHLAAGAAEEDHLTPGPDVRIGDADRDATAAALGEHFAHGRLTLDELHARLGATLTATTHGELSQATRDLPEAAVLPDHRTWPRRRSCPPGRTS
jgi:DNA-binding transcriptional ArsR family regulator